MKYELSIHATLSILLMTFKTYCFFSFWNYSNKFKIKFLKNQDLGGVFIQYKLNK